MGGLKKIGDNGVGKLTNPIFPFRWFFLIRHLLHIPDRNGEGHNLARNSWFQMVNVAHVCFPVISK